MAKILAIDDNKDNLAVLKAVLQDAFSDSELLFSESGKEGLNLCQSNPPDVILLDLVMPQMDGFEVCAQLKSNDSLKSIPIIVLTALKTNRESRIKALDMGADAFLSKPIDETELIAQIKVMLRIKESEDIKQGESLRLSQQVLERTHQLEQELMEKKRADEEQRSSLHKLEESKKSSLNLMADLKTEILERRAAEERINQLNERLTLAKDAAKFGIWDRNLTTNLLIWDDKMYEIYGLSKSTFSPTYSSWLDLIFNDDRDKVVTISKQALNGEAEYNTEFRILHHDGSIRYIKALGLVIRDSSNNPIRMTGINYDITSAKRAEEALLESKSQLDLAIRSAKMGVWVWDIVENKRYFDNQTCLSLGINPTTFNGTEEEFSKIIHADDREKIVYARNQAIDHDHFYEIDYRVIWPDGSIHYISARGQLVCNENKKPIKLNGVIWDTTEHKLAQEAVRLSNQKMSLLFEQTPLAVIEWDKDFNVKDWNPSAKKIFGYSKMEALGKHFSFILPNHELHQINEIRLLLINQRGGHRSTNENITKNGLKIICEWFNTPLVDANGKAFGVASLVHDITERRQAELALQNSNNQWNVTFNSIQDSIMMLDTNQRIIKYNKAFANQIGKRINDKINPYCYNLVHGTDCPIDGCPFTKMKASREREILNFEIDNRFYDCMVDPIFDNKGSISGAVHIINDITIRKQAEINLIKKNKEVQSLLLGAKAVLDFENFDITARKLFTICKELIGASAGYVALLTPDGTENHILSLTPNDSISTKPPEFPLPIRGLRAKAYETGKPIFENDFSNSEWFKRMPPGHIPLKNVLFAPLIINKKAVGLFGLSNKKNDFTDEDMKLAAAFGELASLALHNTRTLEELICQKDKAEESEMLKSVFLANMSHEIRTPLNAILGFSDFLGEPSLTVEKRNKFIDIINSSGQQLLHIINDIIDISKLESKQLTLSNQECNITVLLTEIVEVFKRSEALMNKPEIKLILSLPHQQSDTLIITDKFRLQQVLNNLISNAIKYTNKGFVEVGYKLVTKYNASYIEFFVNDSGIGIPNDKHKIIFERFRQVEENGYREGTGLGLSISKGIINLLGGEIWFNSTVNKGTSFFFTLPYRLILTDTKVDTVKEQKSTDLANRIILIAEDDYNSFRFIKELLLETNASIIYAENGQVLLNLLKEVKPDIILLDINMPIKTGYQCMQEIKAKGYKVKVIAQTAYAMAEEKEKCLNAGCDGYISKPFNKEILLSAISNVLGI
ncbi:MAG: response regulator [Bacteroidales bacterium]|nr:MAG: response regulator [Bacteroidales bacterium]